MEGDAMRTVVSVILLPLLLALGCGDDNAPSDAATDGGARMDAGPDATPDDDGGATLTGCATPASESFARPFEVSAEDYPFRSCAFETDAGLIHYIDEGPPDAEETIVVVHGNPTWSFLYRNIATAMIADGHRFVALDHLGMGMSDIPPTSEFDYRPRHHAANLEALVVALDLENITLVVQDWGGPIGLGMATRQPDRIGRILIMNTWAWSVDAEDPGLYHEAVAWSAQAKALKELRPTAFCDFFLPGQSELTAAEVDPTRGALYERVVDAYVSPHIDATGGFRTTEPCAPMQIFAESITDDDAFQGEVEAVLDVLVGKPYALLFGLSDELFGALRCHADSPPCPGASTCECDPELLPSRVAGGCEDPAAAEFHVCKEPDGAILEPYADRFELLLGTDAQVSRDVVPGADHMIQEWAPEQVIAALRGLIASEGTREGPWVASQLEIIDNATGMGWMALDMTRETYDALELSPGWTRNVVDIEADVGEFLRSPDDPEGVFTDASLFDHEWRHVVSVRTRGMAVDPEGLLSRVVVEKAHRLTYDPGRTVTVLTSPEGASYVLQTRDPERSSEVATIPEGWTLEEAPTGDGLTVLLPAEVTLLRGDNGDAFQGPLPRSTFFPED
ncbi:MAG: alpha/beta fold hydrolase [Myxococcota bacterium]